MHSSTHYAALALVLLLWVAPPARAQAPLPPGFVDAAAVVDGLVVDMHYFGDNNFVGQRIDGYERPRCLLSVPAANALAAIEA
jgi:D-alanyl-D-alanine dipeptidase